jgi:transcriptional regulator with XRE-family HTH domain
VDNRVRELRRGLGLKQRELEERTGIERSKLSRIETNDRNITGTEALFLAEALAVSPEDLYVGAHRTQVVRYRGGSEMPERAKRTADWFRHFVDDASFVDRTARRYGIE